MIPERAQGVEAKIMGNSRGLEKCLLLSCQGEVVSNSGTAHHHYGLWVSRKTFVGVASLTTASKELSVLILICRSGQASQLQLIQFADDMCMQERWMKLK